jgi:uncharacterized DUF497 family protein
MYDHGSELRFEWSAGKAAGNRRKHGVSFEEACGAFYDALALLIEDPIHSIEEERFVLLGIGSGLRLLVVVHCYRGDCIRIISAREANSVERAMYG